VLHGVDRATVTRAVGEVRSLLAARGFAVPGLPGVRLRTLADVFAYAAAHGVELRIDGTETQARRPRGNRPGRRAFVSGKRKQNTIKTTTISEGQGRTRAKWQRVARFETGPGQVDSWSRPGAPQGPGIVRA
jgi:hypothetical protein